MHDNAAGCSILDSKLNEFHKYANQELENIDFGENIYEVNFERFGYDDDLIRLIEDIGGNKNLWGQKNSVPLIYVKDIILAKKDIGVIGRNNDTLRFEYRGITYLKFFAKDFIKEIGQLESDFLKISLVGEANLNEWNNRVTPQIMISDLEVKEKNLLEF